MSSRVPSGAEGAFAFIAEHTSDLIVRADTQGILTYVSPLRVAMATTRRS